MREEEVHGGHGEENHTELCFAGGCRGESPYRPQKGAHGDAKARSFALQAASGEKAPAGRQAGSSARGRRLTQRHEGTELCFAGGCRGRKPSEQSTVSELASENQQAAALRVSLCRRPSEEALTPRHGVLPCRRLSGGESFCRPPSGGFSPREKRGTHKGTEARSFALRAAARGESPASKALFPSLRAKTSGRLPCE